MNLLESPEGFFALFVGLFLLSEIAKGFIQKGTSKMSDKAKTREGIIAILIMVGVIWVIFAAEIAALFDLINSNGVAILGMALIIIGFMIWRKRGVKEDA